MLNKFIISTLALLLSLSASTHAQVNNSDEPRRPKIGLVLSGGGAKGLAHVGILKAIDRAGLHIDYVTGTSMGAIVAAMYAAGYNGEQIQEIAKGMEWMSLISSKTQFTDISIESKEEFENHLVAMPMEGLHFKPWTGIFEPYQVMLKLKEVFYPVYKVKDFTKLDIPFRCISTDLANGDAVVMESGDLAFATRSSMAIPGVFAATNYNGTKLVDGGIVRNFPVRDVLEMGADYVIGVNLFAGLDSPDDMSTALDVMMQAINFRDAKDLIEEKAICDMLIEPDVSHYNAASFAAADTILAIGDSTGIIFEPLFKQLADSLHRAYGTPYNSINRMNAYDSHVRIQGFKIEGLKATSEQLLLHNLNLRAGHQYKPSDFTEAIKKAMSTGYYSNIIYELEPVSDDNNLVVFRCHVEENSLALLKVALSYNTFSNASIFLDYQIRNLIDDKSISNVKVAISKDFRFKINHRELFGLKNNFYLDAVFEHSRFYIPYYGSDKSKETTYTYDHNNALASWGYASKPDRDVTFKLGWEQFRVSSDIAGDAIMNGRNHTFYFDFCRRINTLDNKRVPTKGLKLDLDAYCGIAPFFSIKGDTTSNFDRKTMARVTLKTTNYQTLTDRFTISESFAGAIAYHDRVFSQKTALGGCEEFLPSHFVFYGLNTARRFESTMFMLRASARYRVFSDLYTLFHLNSAVTFANLDKYIIDKQKFRAEDWVHGAGLTVAYDFRFMPMDITLMYSPEAKFNVSVNVGFLF